MAAALQAMGCFACGMAAAPSANVVNGVVTFDPTAVGDSEMLNVNFHDTADVTETITSASISGADADAFQVFTTFPSTVPAGTQIMVEIEFTPTHSGPSSATLTLNTQAMGPSPIQLEGKSE